MALTAAERTLRARMAAHAMHARNDSRQVSKPGRDAVLARFEAQVDPDGTLDPDERARRAKHAQRAHMQRLAWDRERKRREAS